MPKFLISLLSVLSCGIVFTHCSRTTNETANAESHSNSLVRETFGKLPDGRIVYLYSISNGNGVVVKVSNYGGIITSIITPDKDGNPGDVVLGYDSLSDYLGSHPHVGPLIGRYSGYVADARFVIDDVEYKLTANAGRNQLHGGRRGFDKVLWDAEELQPIDGRGIKLTYRSPDGEEGYPGNLDVSVTYIVTEDNSLQINYEAECDKKTHVNLTNHLYFNLSALQSPDIMKHELQIGATRYAVPGEGNIATGELRSVEGTPLDFREPTPMGARIGELTVGYDHNYVIKTKNDDELIQAATVFDPVSGRFMELFTTHTGLEFASADWLDLKGKAGKTYGKRAGFLLYPQHLPDSPNRPDFPSTLLEPGQKYSQATVYTFSVREEGL